VLTYVQLGTPFELAALRGAARVAAAADRAGLEYVCEIMPIEGPAYPDPADPLAIVAACRVSAELGARLTKTTMPSEPAAIGDAVGFGVPVVLAGGDVDPSRDAIVGRVRRAVAAGAAGVAFGRNVWSADDPAAMVAALAAEVHR
jgi:DhnA family fructose-bisphosphate aldolase class Ia